MCVIPSQWFAGTGQWHPDQIPFDSATRPVGSKWKHPSSAAPPTSASRSTDVDNAPSLITFRTTRRSEFGGVIVVGARVKLYEAL